MKFKTGDRVIITGYHPYNGDEGLNGKPGVILNANAKPFDYWVTVEDRGRHLFLEDELSGYPEDVEMYGERLMSTEPVDPFEDVLTEISMLNRKKRADYASDDDPWQNFKDSGYQIGQPAGVSVETLIATKQSRLRQLLSSGREAENESVEDTLLDRAVYSIIALAMYREGLYQEGNND